MIHEAVFALILTISFSGSAPSHHWKAWELSKPECESQRELALLEAETHSVLSRKHVKFSARCVQLSTRLIRDR